MDAVTYQRLVKVLNDLAEAHNATSALVAELTDFVVHGDKIGFHQRREAIARMGQMREQLPILGVLR